MKKFLSENKMAILILVSGLILVITVIITKDLSLISLGFMYIVIGIMVINKGKDNKTDESNSPSEEVYIVVDRSGNNNMVTTNYGLAQQRKKELDSAPYGDKGRIETWENDMWIKTE